MAGSCGITAAWINAHWKKQQELLSLSFNDKIRALQEQIDANVNESNGNSVSGTPNVSPEGGLTPAQVYAQNVSSVVAIECSSNYGLSSGSGSSRSSSVQPLYHLRYTRSYGRSYSSAHSLSVLMRP